MATDDTTGLVPHVGDHLPDPRPEMAVDKLRRRYEKLQTRDLDTVSALARFSDLDTKLEDPTQAKLQLLLMGPDEAVVAAGWKSKRELRLAYYGTLPKKDWPAAAQAAHERVGMRLRKQTKVANKYQFNLQMVSIPSPRRDPDARVVIVAAAEPKDKK